MVLIVYEDSSLRRCIHFISCPPVLPLHYSFYCTPNTVVGRLNVEMSLHFSITLLSSHPITTAISGNTALPSVTDASFVFSTSMNLRA